ncbi:hypothetical protein RSAG8_13686, partial [Rhizoctonia solani AG-8 WAC10335]
MPNRRDKSVAPKIRSLGWNSGTLWGWNVAYIKHPSAASGGIQVSMPAVEPLILCIEPPTHTVNVRSGRGYKFPKNAVIQASC